MDVTQVQSGAGYQVRYTPAASPGAGPAIDVTNTGKATIDVRAAADGSLSIHANAHSSPAAQSDIADIELASGQSLTIRYALTQSALKLKTPLVVTPVDSSGLVPGPGGVLYRPGAVNPYGTPPPAGTSEVHAINWGGFGSPQATPAPTRIIDDHPTTMAGVFGGEILFLPVQDAPHEQAAHQTPATVAAPAAGLQTSTNPFDAANIEVRGGRQSQSPAAPAPLPSRPIPAASSGPDAPLFESWKPDFVSTPADGKTAVNANSTPATSADLSGYLKAILSGTTFGSSGAIARNGGAPARSTREGRALDVTA